MLDHPTGTIKMFQISRRNALFSATALTLGATSFLQACSGSNKSAAMSDDMTMGDPNAKITFIEYASPTCVHCATFAETVMPELKKKYIETGKVHYIFREFLTQPVETAAATFLLARCAGKEKYFGVLDSMWRALPQLQTGGPSAARDILLNIAKTSGINEDQFTKCITDPESLTALTKKVDGFARDQQIDSTPSFFINGTRFDYNGGGISEFDAAFKPLLDAKK